MPTTKIIFENSILLVKYAELITNIPETTRNSLITLIAQNLIKQTKTNIKTKIRTKMQTMRHALTETNCQTRKNYFMFEYKFIARKCII